MAHRPRARRRAPGARGSLPGALGIGALSATFDLPGGTFHALVLGDASWSGDAGPRGETPPLIYLHGFPDCPATAYDFLDELSVSHPIIAPYLRGYAPSPTRGPYDLETVASDILAMIDRWIGAPVDLVGHDWGAALTYTLCMMAPAKIRRAVTLACPHPRTLLRSLRTPAQLRRSWYMAFFQLPLSAHIARARDFALIDRLWRTWSPNFSLDEGCRKTLHACLSASWPAPVRYYQPQRFRGDCIATPLLQLHGADDGCIVPPTDEDSHRFRARVLEIVPRAGHFLHLENPSGIAARIRNWFAQQRPTPS